MANYKVLATWDISIQNLYKDITLIQQGISCKLNISLRSISRVIVNYKVGNEYVTDLCTIDLDNNKVIVPFKKNVLEVGTHALELVCHMKNGDVLPTPNYSYTVTKSLTNDNDITEEDAYPVLIGMIQELTKNEAVIQANEEARANAEMYRELNEDERQNAEAERKANENTRISNENIRQSNESNRQQYETQRRVEEDERLTDEQVRVNAENIRIANENERLRKEIERQNAEELRQIAYNSSLYGRMDVAESQLERMENNSIYSYISNYEKYEGETYDTERLQRALDDCSVSGKILVINENLALHRKHIGSVACSIIMPSNITMIGIDGVEIKLENGLGGTCRMFNVADVENIRIENIKFNGNRYGDVSDNEQMHIFFIEGGTHITFSNCHFFEPRGDGISIRKGDVNPYCHHIIVDNCIFESCGRNGFTFGSGYRYITITNSHFKGNTYAQHIDSEPDSSTLTEGVYISNNFLNGAEGGGIFTVSTLGGNTTGDLFIIENNVMLDTELYLNGGYNCIIKNNTIKFTQNKNLYSFPISLRGDVYNIRICDNIIDCSALIDSSYVFSGSNIQTVPGCNPNNIQIYDNNIRCYNGAFEFLNTSHIKIFNNEIINVQEVPTSIAFRMKPNKPEANMRNIQIKGNTIVNFNIFIDLQPTSSATLDFYEISDNILEGIASYGVYTVNTSMTYITNFIYTNNIVLNPGENFNPFRKSTNAYYKTYTNTGLGEILYCQGSPEGVFEAPMGSIAIDMNSGNMYLKQSVATSNTGWILK